MRAGKFARRPLRAGREDSLARAGVWQEREEMRPGVKDKDRSRGEGWSRNTGRAQSEEMREAEGGGNQVKDLNSAFLLSVQWRQEQ